jgi:hypothetical protein
MLETTPAGLPPGPELGVLARTVRFHRVLGVRDGENAGSLSAAVQKMLAGERGKSRPALLPLRRRRPPLCR